MNSVFKTRAYCRTSLITLAMAVIPAARAQLLRRRGIPMQKDQLLRLLSNRYALLFGIDGV